MGWLLKLNKRLEAYEPALDAALILAIIILGALLLFGKPVHKAAAVSWIVLP